MTYSIQFKPVVEKDLKGLSKMTLLRVFKLIIALQNQPLPHQALKLSGAGHLYRLRVGDYRIIYEIDRAENIIIVHYIRHRKDVYRKM